MKRLKEYIFTKTRLITWKMKKRQKECVCVRIRKKSMDLERTQLFWELKHSILFFIILLNFLFPPKLGWVAPEKIGKRGKTYVSRKNAKNKIISYWVWGLFLIKCLDTFVLNIKRYNLKLESLCVNKYIHSKSRLIVRHILMSLSRKGKKSSKNLKNLSKECIRYRQIMAAKSTTNNKNDATRKICTIFFVLLFILLESQTKKSCSYWIACQFTLPPIVKVWKLFKWV